MGQTEGTAMIYNNINFILKAKAQYNHWRSAQAYEIIVYHSKGKLLTYLGKRPWSSTPKK